MGDRPIGPQLETTMPTLSPHEATEKLTRSVERMDANELLDFYNDVFLQERKSELSPVDSGADDRRKILDYIAQGLEIEEILDFWYVVLPGSRNVYYDDEDSMIHYSEYSEAAQSSE
jgi:hypothetical protein